VPMLGDNHDYPVAGLDPATNVFLPSGIKT
jgi:hypothetical protein